MPGPKMGPRPRDFDEKLVRRSPTFRKWEGLLPGAKLRYACRDFVKGHGSDEERLMRRIMIARRNNVRDHQALKWARRMQSSNTVEDAETMTSSVTDPLSSFSPQKGSEGVVDAKEVADRKVVVENDSITNKIGTSRSETESIVSRTSHLLPGEQDEPPGRRTRRPTSLISDEAIKDEMDVSAVESTRSYKTWLSLPIGAEFLYNQKYIKGQEAHDWLLRKNIWRRMRYRRENKKMVEEMLSRERREAESISQQSRKRRHDGIGVRSVGAPFTATVEDSNKRNRSMGEMDRMIVEAGAPTIMVGTPTSTTSVLGINAGIHATNRQESVASTASEIVDHALLSTNTGGVPSTSILSTRSATSGDAIDITIGHVHHQDHLQQFQEQPPSVYPPTHPHHLRHHQHHDATESAAAFAASIALAGVGVGIGTDGDLNAHHDAAVTDSAAVEAAVAAALAATDTKSNTYHLHHHHHHHHQNHQITQHLSHPAVNDHAGLMGVDHIIHPGNDPLAGTSAADERGLQSVSQMAEASASASPMSLEAKSTAAATSTHHHPGTEGVVTGLGLALDAAARLAAAAAATTTCASDEAVLAATKAINATIDSSIGIGKASNDGSNIGGEAPS